MLRLKSEFQSLGRILGLVAHEVSGPIGLIQSCLHLLPEESSDLSSLQVMETACREHKGALEYLRLLSSLAAKPSSLVHEEVLRAVIDCAKDGIEFSDEGELVSLASLDATEGAWRVLLSCLSTLFGTPPTIRSDSGGICVDVSFGSNGSLEKWDELQRVVSGDVEAIVSKYVWLNLGIPFFILRDHCGLTVKIDKCFPGKGRIFFSETK